MMEQCKRTVARRYLGMGHKFAVGPGYSGLLGKSKVGVCAVSELLQNRILGGVFGLFSYVFSDSFTQ